MWSYQYVDLDDAGSLNLGTKEEPYNTVADANANGGPGIWQWWKRTAVPYNHGSNLAITAGGDDVNAFVMAGYGTVEGDADGNPSNFFQTSGQLFTHDGKNSWLMYFHCTRTAGFQQCAIFSANQFRLFQVLADSTGNSGVGLQLSGSSLAINCRGRCSGSSGTTRGLYINSNDGSLAIGCIGEASSNASGSARCAELGTAFSAQQHMVDCMLRALSSSGSEIGIFLTFTTNSDDSTLLAWNSILGCEKGITVVNQPSNYLGIVAMIGNVLGGCVTGFEDSAAAGRNASLFTLAQAFHCTGTEWVGVPEFPPPALPHYSLSVNPFKATAPDYWTPNGLVGGGADILNIVPPVDLLFDGSDAGGDDGGAQQVE